MKSENSMLKRSPFIPNLLIVAIALGISFRFLAIDQKLYWHDEVYTSMRAAGYTRQQIDQELFQNQITLATELQKYQQIKPNSTNSDTVQSLKVEDPQHPPLYFLMARQWLIWFGGSITASRLLPALLSLLALPLIYGLATELFSDNNSVKTQLIGLIATAFLALSPFDILFAQTARQYSLLTVGVIGTSYALLQALSPARRSLKQTFISWSIYSLGVAIALYIHPFFGLTLIGHGVFILGCQRQQLKEFILAMGIAITLYSPWIIVLITNFRQTTSTTSWGNAPVSIIYLSKFWILTFTSVFFDLDFGFNNLLTFSLRLPIIGLIAFALYLIYRHNSIYLSSKNRAKWFIFTSIFVPFLLLLLPDLILGGRRSSVSRYLISCLPAIQLAMAYLLAQMLNFSINFNKTILWRGILIILLTASLVSNVVSANSSTWWTKDLSYYNAQVSDRLNAVSNPIVISDIGDTFTNTGDLISLSYSLNSDVKLLLLNQSAIINSSELIEKLKKYPNHIYVFRPSLQLFKALNLQDPTDLIFPEGQLWKLNLTSF